MFGVCGSARCMVYVVVPGVCCCGSARCMVYVVVPGVSSSARCML